MADRVKTSGIYVCPSSTSELLDASSSHISTLPSPLIQPPAGGPFPSFFEIALLLSSDRYGMADHSPHDTESPCFDGWLGKEIRLKDSGWVLIEKLRDKHTQLSRDSYITFDRAPSAAWGTFLCQNVKDLDAKAIMRIYMQQVHLCHSLLPRLNHLSLPTMELTNQSELPRIPHAGSDLLPRHEVLAQARGDWLPSGAVHEVLALRTFAKEGCDSAPKLLELETDTQGSDDLLPGGFITYLLMSRAPGIQLDPKPLSWDYCREEDQAKANFWKFTPEERERIRQGVKTAWM